MKKNKTCICPICNKNFLIDLNGLEMEQSVNIMCPYCNAESVYYLDEILNKPKTRIVNRPYQYNNVYYRANSGGVSFKFFDVEGRATRREFWIKTLAYGIINCALIPLVAINHLFLPLIILTRLVFEIEMITTCIRRFHDIDMSGTNTWCVYAMYPFMILYFYDFRIFYDFPWLGIFYFIAMIICLIYTIIAGFSPGKLYQNQYGPNPRI